MISGFSPSPPSSHADLISSLNRPSNLVMANTTTTKENRRTHDQDNTSPDKQLPPSGIFALPEIDFPRFSGEEPRMWIFKAECYFKLIHAGDRVLFATMHFDGAADLWYANFSLTVKNPTWEEFVGAVLKRFDSTDPVLVLGEFGKLTQEDSVGDYLTRFENLRYRMMPFFPELSEKYYSSCFISGLKDELKFGVMNTNPVNLTQAIVSATRQEKSVDAIVERMSELCAPATIFLTSAEMADRMEKNLCYNCDEVYYLDHRCKTRQFYCLMSTEEEIEHLENI